MTIPIEGVTCRAVQGTTTTTASVTDTDMLPNGEFPKFAVVDIWLQSANSSDDTNTGDIRATLSFTRWFVDANGSAVCGLQKDGFSPPEGVNSSGAVINVVRLDTANQSADVAVVLSAGGLIVSVANATADAQVHYVARMYSGRGILNAKLVSQQSNTTSVTGLSFEPNTLLAMGSFNTANNPAYAFGCVDSTLTQASYCVASTSSDTGSAVSNSGTGLRMIRGDVATSVSVVTVWEVTAFTSDGWTNTKAGTGNPFYLVVPIHVIALRLADPTDFEADLSVDSNTLSDTVTLDNPFCNINWETVRGCVRNGVTIDGGTAGTSTGLSTYSVDTATGVPVGSSWVVDATAAHSYISLNPNGVLARVIDTQDDINEWTPTLQSGNKGLDYARTSGSALSDDVVYFSWGFVQSAKYNIYVGGSAIADIGVGITPPDEILVGLSSVTNAI
jgi:hypothetical protein